MSGHPHHSGPFPGTRRASTQSRAAPPHPRAPHWGRACSRTYRYQSGAAAWRDDTAACRTSPCHRARRTVRKPQVRDARLRAAGSTRAACARAYRAGGRSGWCSAIRRARAQGGEGQRRGFVEPTEEIGLTRLTRCAESFRRVGTQFLCCPITLGRHAPTLGSPGIALGIFCGAQHDSGFWQSRVGQAADATVSSSASQDAGVVAGSLTERCPHVARAAVRHCA